MKWIFMAAALYIVFVANISETCNSKRLNQYSPEEKKIIQRLQLKTKGELELLLDMEISEKELLTENYYSVVSRAMTELSMLEKKLETLSAFLSQEELKYFGKISNLEREYRGDLTRCVHDSK